MTIDRARSSSAAAVLSRASATLMSGLLTRARSSHSSSCDFAFPVVVPPLPLPVLLDEDPVPDPPGGRCPKAGTAPRHSANRPASGAERLLMIFRILFLLLTGVLDGHQQPVVVGGDGQVFLRGGFEGSAVAAQGRLQV